jgi:phosphate starvation-inducible protein PhoH
MPKRKALQVISNINENVGRDSKLKIRIDDLATFDALTETQGHFFCNYNTHKAFLLHGSAGTGKTFIALYKALEEVLDKANPYQKVIIVRSAVPSREIGHLPGDYDEKTEIYSLPYQAMVEEMFPSKQQVYQRLMEQKYLYFMCTSFVRGITLDDAIIIVDECQNMNDMELNSIMTRVGRNTKILYCGDFRQTDLYRRNDMSGLSKFHIIAEMMPSFCLMEFTSDDIIRSDLVKEYIQARMKYEDMYEIDNVQHKRSIA